MPDRPRDTFPRQYARTRRFTLGRPHEFTVSPDGSRVVFLRSPAGDGFKIERPSFRPGQTIRIPLDLAIGVYKIECWVANHDDLGMQILLEVRPDAPKVRQPTAGGDAVSIQGFAFEPPELNIPPGTEVTWTNEDPEAHTVTAEDGSFESGPIEPGRTFSVRIEDTGRIAYICRIHPSMTGTLRVR